MHFFKRFLRPPEEDTNSENNAFKWQIGSVMLLALGNFYQRLGTEKRRILVIFPVNLSKSKSGQRR